MTALEDLARRICAVLDDGSNVLSGSAMHAMLQQACAPTPTLCPEKLKPGGCQLHNLQCGWPACNKPPEARGWSAADADSDRASYEVPR